jgi:1-acyl-sn-glycerol-3-phosphate acyltransferase
MTKINSVDDISRKPTGRELLFYSAVRNTITGFCRVFWRMKIIGRENIPATGAFILSGVHRSNIDTPISCATTRRRMRYMGKETLWGVSPAADWFFNTLGGFPVQRGTADREALRKCQIVLEAGEPLVMFPEGTRQSGPVVEGFHDGPSFVSGRTGAPIVPFGVGGAEVAMPHGQRWLKPVKLVIVIGEPIPAPCGEDGGRPNRRQVREHTTLLRNRVQELFDEAQVLAGHK